MASHLRLVAKVAMRYRWYGLPIEDLISRAASGSSGLSIRFDPGRGHPACRPMPGGVIRASIHDYILRSWSLVKMGTPLPVRRGSFQPGREKSRISALQGRRSIRRPGCGHRQTDLGVAEREVVEMNRRLAGDVSPDRTLERRWRRRRAARSADRRELRSGRARGWARTRLNARKERSSWDSRC